jgi:hypothetical protein
MLIERPKHTKTKTSLKEALATDEEMENTKSGQSSKTTLTTATVESRPTITGELGVLHARNVVESICYGKGVRVCLPYSGRL